jgi:hypothetical protein
LKATLFLLFPPRFFVCHLYTKKHRRLRNRHADGRLASREPRLWLPARGLVEIRRAGRRPHV